MGYTWQEAREAWQELRFSLKYSDTQTAAQAMALDVYFQVTASVVSDVEREPVPIERITFDANCPTRQEQDEYVCAKCLLRWDISEDKPPCRRART